MTAVTEERELKQQGVIESARDPNTSTTAQDAQRKIAEESQKAGIPVFTFDPDASPQQKRAQAQAQAAVPDNFYERKRPNGMSIITDINDDADTPPVTGDLPSATKEVMDVATDAEGKRTTDGQDPEAAEPPYARTGWAPQFGWPYDNVQDADSLLDHTTWLESQLPDHLYGDWYHNTAVIVFACIASWVIAVLGGGLGWIFIIMAICATYYRTSLRRVRRNFRDDITRELSLKRLETDHESLEWINSFMLKFWPIYQPVLAQTIINSVDQVLSGSTPGFLDSLKLTQFTLGSKPPRMEYVKTLAAEDDYVVMDWRFSFTPNDTADMTAKQVHNKINPKVVLEMRLGKAMISKGLDVIVEDMSFSATMRLKIKLQIPFPHIDRVEMCFIDRPEIDYVCKPLGGETFGFDINFIPGLESFIQEQIHATLGPMMYAPNVFPIEVSKLLAGTPVDQAVGVVAITLHGAHGLKNSDNFAGSVDPYVVLTLNRRQPLAKTKVVKDNSNPRWNETHYIIISSFNDSLDMQVYDYNEFRKSKELGVASFALEHLESLATYENERLEVVTDGKARGILSCDVRFFPTLEGKKLPDGKMEPPPPSNQGILRFTVEQAKDLDGTKSLVGLLNPYALLHLNGRVIHQTNKKKRTNNPIWDDGYKEILITDRKHAKLGVTVKDDRDLAGDQNLGGKQIKLEDMLENMTEGKEWYHLDGPNSGRVKMMAAWKPVEIPGILGGTGGYITPIGVMRVHLVNATDLRNFETMGKSDPYARILLSGIEKGRTITQRNDLNPSWDEIIYIPVHSARERLMIEVMDAEKVGKDRSLGYTEVYAGDYIEQVETGEYMAHEKVARNDGLKLHNNGTEKGILNYTVAFYPCLSIADPEESESEAEGDRKDSKDNLEVAKKDVPSEKTPPLSPASANFSSQPQAAGRPSTDSRSQPVPKSPALPPSPSTPRKSRDQKLPPVVHLTPEELLQHQSGLVLVRLMEAELPRANTHIEIFVDEYASPSYVSSASKTRTRKYDEIGDCFIRELEFSKLTLKIREKGNKNGDDEEHTLASFSQDTLLVLKQCLNNPTILVLKDDDRQRIGTIRISLKYLPVKMILDPAESISNRGVLRVEVLDAHNLPAEDSNGKSDPFCTFKLDKDEVFKTHTVKKTLNPIWNTSFEVEIPSRCAAKFKVEVWDWDLASRPDWLGAADIDLMQLEPFKSSEMNLKLNGKSGTMRLRLVFKPDHVKRMRHGTSTFTGTLGTSSRIVTGAPARIGHGIGKGTTFLKRGFRGKKDDESLNGSSAVADLASIETNGSAPEVSSTAEVKYSAVDGEVGGQPLSAVEQTPSKTNGDTGNGHVRTKSFGASSTHSGLAAPTGSVQAGVGTATFTVVSAVDFPPSADLYVIISQAVPKAKQVGKTKDRKATAGTVKFDETFQYPCAADAQFKVSTRGKHMLRSDDEYGEALYFVNDQGTGQERPLRVGSGIVYIKSSFAPSGGASPDSPKSQYRKSLLPKKDRSRETTPNLDG